MDNQRLFLFVALSFVVLLLWQSWMEDYGPAPAPQVETAALENAQPPATTASLPAGPADSADIPGAPADMATMERALPDTEVLKKGQFIDVTTDLFHIKIDATGGDLRQADLLHFKATTEPDSPPFRLLNDSLPNLFVIQSGLRASVGTEPTHHVVYTAEQGSYRMADGADELQVSMVWRSPEGVEVVKRYIFHRGSYAIGLQHEVRNNSTAEWQGRQYRQLQRTQVAETGQSSFIYTYMGGVIYSPEEKYEKIKFEDMVDENLDRSITDGWAAMLQHYFLGALIPARAETDRYYTNTLSSARYVIGMISPNREVASGSSALYETTIFIGPKLQDEMKQVAPGLELTVDYGLLTVLAQPLFWLLKTLHGLLGNWGWAIVCVTVLIKLAFYKLSETSYKSMANMRKLAPRMKTLKERYGDDRQKMNQAMMEMYKKEKINPLGGCLPIVVQIPVFIALYWVLLESVELRHAPFILWITDMSSPDPYYILPLLMGATMLIQQRLNPAPMDPIQAKVMMMLPIVFTVFFAFFPSGLVLYWVVNNTLSIAQQWVITRRIERGGK
jgi:YidC/Oxa1 family membrane protein insertase